MDTTTYDVGKLDLADLLELRSLQAKARDENVTRRRPDEDLSRLTLDELLRLEDLYYKMAGEPNPHKPTPEHVAVIATRENPGGSGVTAASPAVAPEPVAVAPAAAPAKPAAPATPAPAAKLKLPAEDVLSAARQLDSILRFGV